MLRCELLQVWQARHCSILTHDLTDDCCRLQAGQASQIDARFCVTSPRQHTTRLRPQRKHVSRLHQIQWCACLINHYLNRARPITRRDAGGDTRRRIYADCECSSLSFSILLHHHGYLELLKPLACQRHADQTAAKASHEIHGLGRYLIGSNYQVALIFPIGVVYHDEKLPNTKVHQCVFDRRDY